MTEEEQETFEAYVRRRQEIYSRTLFWVVLSLGLSMVALFCSAVAIVLLGHSR